MEKAETVFLVFPRTGEVREVEPTAEILTPLMAKGWHQTTAPPVKVQPAAGVK